MSKPTLTDAERIARLELVLSNLILWLKGTLSTPEVLRLLAVLKGEREDSNV